MRSKIAIAFTILLIAAFAAAVFNRIDYGEITGNDVRTGVNILNISFSGCDYNFTQGWNYVSFHCISNSAAREDVMQNVPAQVIYTYNAFDGTDPWKSYNPSLPNWTVQQVKYMSRMSGYIIYVSNDTHYNYTGYKRPSSIQLRAGWNFVGFPRDEPMPINETTILLREVVTIKDGTLLSYMPNATNNTLFEFEPYGAYWIDSSASQTWMVN